MSEYPTYHIKSVADFLQVPENRIEACLEDFKSFLHIAKHTSELLNMVGTQVAEEEGLNIEPPFFSCEGFTWIDDGKHDATVRIGSISDASGSDRP